MPGCSRLLATEAGTVGEMAHIHARSPKGPRGESAQSPDTYKNLILLCEEHHKLVDSNPDEWPAERLFLIKALHEKRVGSALKRAGGSKDARTLTVFCGASSVGKDVIASRVQRQVRHRYGFEMEFLNKYTSRRKRSDRESTPRDARIEGSLYEPSSTYEFLLPDEMPSHPDCFFKYRKYGGKQYAFSRSQLASQNHEDRNLACILGALHRAAEFRKKVEKEFHRGVFSVLIEAEEQELYDRLDLRSTFGAEERSLRRAEIQSDLDRIQHMRDRPDGVYASFDFVIYNGGNALPEAAAAVADSVGQWLRWWNWAHDHHD